MTQCRKKRTSWLSVARLYLILCAISLGTNEALKVVGDPPTLDYNPCAQLNSVQDMCLSKPTTLLWKRRKAR